MISLPICSRPAISENRILNYDGINVTFFYNDHKDNSYLLILNLLNIMVFIEKNFLLMIKWLWWFHLKKEILIKVY